MKTRYFANYNVFLMINTKDNLAETVRINKETSIDTCCAFTLDGIGDGDLFHNFFARCRQLKKIATIKLRHDQNRVHIMSVKSYYGIDLYSDRYDKHVRHMLMGFYSNSRYKAYREAKDTYLKLAKTRNNFKQKVSQIDQKLDQLGFQNTKHVFTINAKN